MGTAYSQRLISNLKKIVSILQGFLRSLWQNFQWSNFLVEVTKMIGILRQCLLLKRNLDQTPQ